MPPSKSWKPHIPEVIKQLQMTGEYHVDRQRVEQLLGVSRSQADLVMHAAKIVTSAQLGLPGKTNWVTAENLIRYLECHYDPEAQKEHARTARLGRKLKEAEDERPLRQKEVHYRDRKQVVQVLKARIEDVPGCSLVPPSEGKPGEFRLSYVSTVDLLGKFVLFALAIINHEEQFAEMTSPL